MGTKINYEDFILSLDKKLHAYFLEYDQFVCCRAGCSACCEKGDYPLSNIELEYLMKGYVLLSADKKIQVQQNLKSMEKGGKCPFLIEKKCSVYEYRPIVCRVHGLPYLYKDNCVKLPYCANEGKNFANNYIDGEFVGQPITENLDTEFLLQNFKHETKNLYDWIHTVI